MIRSFCGVVSWSDPGFLIWLDAFVSVVGVVSIGVSFCLGIGFEGEGLRMEFSEIMISEDS